jgi:hypothetical protein
MGNASSGGYVESLPPTLSPSWPALHPNGNYLYAPGFLQMSGTAAGEL